MGHGIGLDVHGRPFLSVEDGETPLETGMTFTDRPSILLDGRFGMRTEDVIVVGEGGRAAARRRPAATPSAADGAARRLTQVDPEANGLAAVGDQQAGPALAAEAAREQVERQLAPSASSSTYVPSAIHSRQPPPSERSSTSKHTSGFCRIIRVLRPSTDAT